MSDRSSFSPFWHRVRTLKPRLRPHVQIVRQFYRGQRWHVVQDPTSNAYFRLNPVAHEFVGLMDGRRTIEEIWEYGLTRRGDDALTQNEVIQVLAQLHAGNLIQADIAPETEQLLGRGRERTQQKFVQQAIGLMYFRVKLLNPDRLLTALEPIFRPFISRVGLVLWLALVISALSVVASRWHEVSGGFESAMAPANWGWLVAGYIALKLWHELGHGLTCKRFGGQVPELGAMMLVLMPSPFVDASSAWTFPSKWKRVVVGAGGMIFELFAASIATFVWARSDPGLARQVAYNVMLTSGVSTLVFNANPLMRFDGYYILSDLLEVPNLMQRSMNLLKFLAQKHLFALDGAQSPTSSPSEAVILLLYGVLAGVYRIVIFFSITLYLLGKMFAIGVVLAVWTSAMWFLLPSASLVRWLTSDASVADRRGRVWGVTAGLIGAGVLLLGVIPWPDHRRSEGVVLSEERAGLFAASDAFVAEVPARPGMSVRAGDVVLRLESPDLSSMLALAEAELNEARATETLATSRSASESQVAQERLAARKQQVKVVREKLEKLTLRAPHDGVVVGDDLSQHLGEFVHEGDALGGVVDTGDLRVAAILSQDQADWVSSLPPEKVRAEARRASRVHDAIPLTLTRAPAAGRPELPHASMGYQGGGKVETRAQERQARGELVAKRPVFTAMFTGRAPAEGESAAAPLGAQLGVPGERVYVRFTLPARPLLAQWVDRLRSRLQGRAKV